jgi:hypothetical protein
VYLRACRMGDLVDITRLRAPSNTRPNDETYLPPIYIEIPEERRPVVGAAGPFRFGQQLLASKGGPPSEGRPQALEGAPRLGILRAPFVGKE